MMLRVRWFHVNWNSNYDTVVKAVLDDIYSEGKDYGFKKNKIRNNFLSASYIQKKEIEEKIENPLTNQTTVYQRTIFEQTMFVLENNKLGIELINPTRNVQSLLNTFASMSDFNITITQLNLDLLKLLKRLQYKFDKFTVQEIECKNIEIENGTTINLIAKNKQCDVFTDIEKFLNHKEYKVEKIKCNFQLDNLLSSFSISRNGSLKISRQDNDILLPILKNTILDL